MARQNFRLKSVRCKAVCLFILFNVFFLLGGIFSPANAEDPPTFVMSFGTSGSGDGQFDRAAGLAVDSSGNIWVSDTYNHRVQKFSSSGTYLSQFGSYGPGNGQLIKPFGIAFDSAGNIYVADVFNHRIQKFSSSGTYLSQFGSYGTGNGQFDHPQNIAFDSADNIYVADVFNHRIQKFSSSGTYLSQFGSYGTGNGQFDHPQNIAFDSADNIYVADVFNHRIQKFSSSGTYLSQFGTSGSGNGQFNGPSGIDVDNSGNIFVVDIENYRVQKFSSSGSYLSQFGGYGTDSGQLNHPIGIAIDNSDNIYVVDSENNRIQKFAYSSGGVIRTLPSCYPLGAKLTVTLKITPSSSSSFIDMIEETVPAGWIISNASIGLDVGMADVSGSKITFLLFDKTDKTLTYDVTPPVTETGDKTFSGTASADNVKSNITGQNIISACPPAEPFVTRTLPSCYVPGIKLTVTLNATPSSTTGFYAIEETAPVGWIISNASMGGVFGSNSNKIIFIDNASRTLAYDITPPVTETGDKAFSGTVSADDGKSNITGQTLISGCHTVRIYGEVYDEYGTGISGVILILSNGGGTVTTDSSGYYSINVPSGWSGEVMPSLGGYTFNPSSGFFSNLISDQLMKFHCTRADTPFTISGLVQDINGTGVSDVTLKSDKGETATTDIFGFYSMTVSSGWSGTLTPSKSDCIFTPASQYFGNIIWNQWQDFTADCGEPCAWISRILPAAYMPGEEFTVTLEAEPPSGTNMYSVEDRCINGWTVSGIGDGGMYDRNTGKVKFGPFQDGKARTLTYSVTPPSSESKDGTFAGTGVINSEARVVGGQTVISKGPETHPADMNTDFSMSIAEMNSYGSAWLHFAPWTLPPNPIPMSYVSKAVELWLNGETYKFDSASGSPPQCWVNTAASTRSQRDDVLLTADRTLPSLYKAGESITVTISVSAAAAGYTIEETPPAGWTASDVSDGGTADGGLVRFWIPSAGGQAKTLTYKAMPPADAKGAYTFGGEISSGGDNQTIAGDISVSDTQPGDLNGDLKADLKDAVIALQIAVATQPPPTAAVGADVNSDRKIGIEEAVFALEKSAE